MADIHEEVQRIRNPQMVRLIRTFTYRGEGTKRREIVQFHDLEGKFAGEYDPAICRTCLEFGDSASLFCTSDHK